LAVAERFQRLDDQLEGTPGYDDGALAVEPELHICTARACGEVLVDLAGGGAGDPGLFDLLALFSPGHVAPPSFGPPAKGADVASLPQVADKCNHRVSRSHDVLVVKGHSDAGRRSPHARVTRGVYPRAWGRRIGR
jgi:hypothetical protein